MRKSVLGLSCLTSLMAWQVYADNTSIHVHGSISPPTCQVNLQGLTQLDWGNISIFTLKENDYTTLPKKNITMQVDCHNLAVTRMAFWIADTNPGEVMIGRNTDGRINHANRASAFNMGVDPYTHKPIGNYTIQPTSLMVDGRRSFAVGYTVGGDHLNTVFNNSKPYFVGAYNQGEDWTIWDTSRAKPESGSVFTINFAVEPQLNKVINLTSADAISWKNGVAQFNVRYF